MKTENKKVPDNTPKKTRHFSLKTALYIATAAVLICVSVMNCVKLNEMTFEVSEIQSETKLIESEIVRLNVELNRITDIAGIEAKAEELGMVKTDSSNVKYICIPSENKTESNVNESGGFLASVARGLSIILAYFS